MKKLSVFIITPHNWFDHVSKNKMNRPLKLAEQFSKDTFFEKVVIISRISPKRLLKGQSERKVVLKGLGYRLLQCNKYLNTLYLEHSFPFGSMESLFLPRIIYKIQKQLLLQQSIFYIFDPKTAPLLKMFSPHLTLFDAYDDWSLSPLYLNRKSHLNAINKGYEVARHSADIIFCNTRTMMKKMEKDRDYVYLLSNASSLEVSNGEEVERYFKEKTVGYIGNLHERIDIELIRNLAETFNQVKFVFIGPNEFKDNSFDDLLKKSNIVHFHSIPYNKVPETITKFDVCFVPHLIDEYTLSQDSMKIYDFLSQGKPVITTNIPPADLLIDYCYVAHSHKEFCDLLSIALDEDDQFRQEARIQYIQKNGWSAKANMVYELIKEVIGENVDSNSWYSNMEQRKVY